MSERKREEGRNGLVAENTTQGRNLQLLTEMKTLNSVATSSAVHSSIFPFLHLLTYSEI